MKRYMRRDNQRYILRLVWKTDYCHRKSVFLVLIFTIYDKKNKMEITSYFMKLNDSEMSINKVQPLVWDYISRGLYGWMSVFHGNFRYSVLYLIFHHKLLDSVSYATQLTKKRKVKHIALCPKFQTVVTECISHCQNISRLDLVLN